MESPLIVASLIAFTISTLLVAVFLFANWDERGEFSWKIFSILLTSVIVFLLFLGWGLLSDSVPRIVEKELIATSKENHNQQIIRFPTQINGECFTEVNVNMVFDREFETNTKFKIKYYAKGPYLGLYGKNQHHNIEIVE